jgi:predicted aldo/keto reductase-like oxidoreductase
MGNLDWQVSALGFGAMRLPVLKSWDQIDEEKAGKMLRYAIDMGVTMWIQPGYTTKKTLSCFLEER